MSIEALKGLNPFQKTMNANMFAKSQVKAVSPVNIQPANIEPNNEFDKNISLFSGSNIQTVNPFSHVNTATKPVSSVIPSGFGQNYSNGLAPSSDLQNVYNGIYKGRQNILNQIAIA